ncbi:TetR family transcriptional regulator [Sporanaerobium hydrogeniformans]|uniref:TetR family transcriptional regulator n=1 Tax=Sporanaerobium hydrogeniformans TaxID=3072179 RepID=A0AC61DDK6_9FIRM|nr:TetR/AcrR family transcriptional regulator [Sporanaerobium hydrogeniformans]PHV70761.1 TetR family transcriptional regulator [Sporanaerobium hydrogeniformans]
MYQSLENFPLRKINYVKTRTTILKTVTNLLKNEDFSAITVDEICQKAQISRGTFFNYFPTKDHIFHYYLRIFTIKVAFRLKELPPGLSFEEKLGKIYSWFSEEKQYIKFFDGYINFLLSIGEEANEMKLIDAEFVYFFNGIKEQEYAYYNGLTLQKLFEDICEKAKANKEITLQKPTKELGALCAGVLTASYVSSSVNKGTMYLDIFNKIWK